MNKIRHECEIVELMIRLYCRKQHNTGRGLCDECAVLLGYASNRLELCCFGKHKPVCSQCTVHCYRPDMRDSIRRVMRFSGPRMLLRHPYAAVAHLIRSIKWFANPVFLFIGCMILPFSTMAGDDSDTTYSDYRVKEKAAVPLVPVAGSGDNGVKNMRKDERDTGSSCNFCISPCMDLSWFLVKNVFAAIYEAASRGAERDERGFDFSAFSTRPIRYGLGGGMGILHFPGIATGFQARFIAHFYSIHSPVVSVRAATGIDGSIPGINAVFVQDVFVDTGKIGTKTDAPESYRNVTVPLMAELMVRPFGSYGSFHCVLGGGGSGVIESIRGIRTFTYNPQRENISYLRFHLRPAVSFGIGWLLMGMNGGMGNLELRYTATFSANRHREPLPGENTSHANQLTIDYTGLF